MEKLSERNKMIKTIVIFGAGKCGKSSIIKQFLNQTFEKEYRATIEDVYNRKFEINGRALDLQFIDTGGLYNFPAMRKLSIKKAIAFVFVFSITDEESLFYLNDILNQINEIHPGGNTNDSPYTSRVPLVVLGNKSDLVNKRCIYEKQINYWLEESKLQKEQFTLTSAKDEDGIWDAFTNLYYQYEKQFPTINDDLETKERMGSNLRRLSAFAALAISPTQQFKTFFNSQINPELVKHSSTASSSISSSSCGNSPNFPIPLTADSATTISQSNSKLKRNSRPSIAKLIKDNYKSGRLKEPIKLDCVIS